MITVVDNITSSNNELKQLMETLLLEHSSIYLWNSPGSGLLTASGNYAYKELDDKGRQLQSQLLEKYQHYYILIKILFKSHPQDTRTELQRTNKIISDTILQKHTWCKNIEEAFDQALEAFDNQISLLKRLYDPTGGECIFIPDTNALLYNPRLEDWEFDNARRFLIIVPPTVLSELDELKINHRNINVRDKADKLINQLKEYRRRGKLSEGVTLRRNRSTIKLIAIEPNMMLTLPWFDKENQDDKILASIVEIMRNHPRSQVVAISRDINFQNKAEYSKIPFIEPPEPQKIL